MSDHLLSMIDFLFKILAAIAAVIAILQLIEVRKKRLIDMYWRIAEIYASEEQRTARSNIHLLETSYLYEKEKVMEAGELMALYNRDYHDSPNEEKRKLDASILNRIRFLNQVGVLLKRRLIDQDMLFGLIGVGLEIDYATIQFVLQAHRKEHHVPYMYLDFEYTWMAYRAWRKRRGLAAVGMV